MRLGRLIRTARERRGWAIDDLARRANASSALVAYVEADHPVLDCRAQVEAMAHALGLTPARVWDEVLAEAGHAPGPRMLGWEVLSVRMIVLQGPVADLDTVLDAVDVDYEGWRPPGLIVVRAPGWVDAGEEQALEMAHVLREFCGPLYQARTSAALRVLWGPSVLCLVRWHPGRVEYQIPAGTCPVVCSEASTVGECPAGMVVTATDTPSDADVAVRQVAPRVWLTPQLHDAVMPLALDYESSVPQMHVMLPLLAGNQGNSGWN